jgi:hypothetical protein
MHKIREHAYGEFKGKENMEKLRKRRNKIQRNIVAFVGIHRRIRMKRKENWLEMLWRVELTGVFHDKQRWCWVSQKKGCPINYIFCSGTELPCEVLLLYLIKQVG